MKSVNRKIRLVQSLWRNFRNVNLNCINDEDPFSLNKLDDIKHVFYIREGDKKYGFEPIEFEYFLRIGGFPVLHTSNYSIESAYKTVFDIKFFNTLFTYSKNLFPEG